MQNSILIQLLYNATLLLALAVVLDMGTDRKQKDRIRFNSIAPGFIIGSFGIGLILTAYELSPGIVFDTRSVLMLVSGFFFGALPTVVAMVMVSVFRLAQGGTGAWVGVSIVLSSGGIGLFWRFLRRKKEVEPSTGELYLLGVAAHLVMLALMFFLPKENALQVFSGIGPPVMLVYPLLTVAVGTLLVNRLRRRRSEDALLSSEERLRITLGSIGDAVITTDTEGRITALNPVAENLTGWNERDARGHPLDKVFRIVNEYTLKPVESPAALVLASGNIVGLANHTMLLSKDGREIPIADSGAPIKDGTGRILGVVLVFRDQTKERDARKAVEEREARYRRLFEAAGDGILILDAETGWVVDVNPFLCKLLGFTHEQFLGKPCWELGFLNDIVANQSNFQQLRQKGCFRFEHIRMTKCDGSMLEAEVINNVYMVGDKKVIQHNIRDITKRTAMEQQQKLLMQVLAVLNRENNVALLIKDVLGLIKTQMGFEAVAIRLHEGDDFPYYETSGFSEHFVEAERYLCERDAAGDPVRDPDGDPALECMCGNVLCGRFDADKPFFTEAGSFWTNSTSELLCATTEQDRQARTRNRCNSEGYESVALITLRSGSEVIGLLQLNDHRKEMFTLDMIRFFEGLGSSIGIALARKQAADAIRSVAMFASENPNPVLRIGEDGTLLYANRAAEILQPSLKASEGAAVGAEWMEHIRQTVEASKPVEVEINIAGKTFSAIFVPVVKKGYVNVYARDISESKQAEAEKERFLTAIDQASETIVITDDEGTIEYVNPAFEQITGYTREEAIGQNPRILQSGKHDNTFYQHLWDTLLRGETWAGRMTNKRKDGVVFHEDATISPVRDSAGRISNYVAVKRDISDELTREDALRQAQKMEAVGQLAGGIAHDFNNILQSITGFGEILTMGLDRCIAGQPANFEAFRADSEEILKAARHAAKLTRQLLTFSRTQKTELRAINLNTVLMDDMRMLSKAVTDSVQIECELAPGLPLIYADTAQIMQTLLNLVVNARDAMPNGGVVTIAAEAIRIGSDDVKQIPHSCPGEFICLSVSDTGTGMDAEQLEHLFEPFFTSKEVDKGTGLGLAVVYGIVQNHHGWVNVSSVPGSGTTFRIYLPIHGGEEGAPDDSSEGGREAGPHILLVDDDPVVQSLAGEILQSMGYEVSCVGSVQEAKDLFARKGGAFDLLFIDVLLPDGNGIELAEALRHQSEGLPVLLFSGGSDEQVNKALIDQKGFAFIKKPFSLNKVIAAVRKTITES